MALQRSHGAGNFSFIAWTYLNLTVRLNSLLQLGQLNVRVSKLRMVGSIRAIIVCVPHFGQFGCS